MVRKRNKYSMNKNKKNKKWNSNSLNGTPKINNDWLHNNKKNNNINYIIIVEKIYDDFQFLIYAFIYLYLK